MLKQLFFASLMIATIATAQAASRTVTIGFSGCDVSTNDRDNYAALLQNSIDWVSKSKLPYKSRVLVLIDDMVSKNDKTYCEPILSTDIIASTGYATDIMIEPPRGVKLKKLANYDVIVLIAGSSEVDDRRTIDNLLMKNLRGTGLVLIGNDIFWNKGSTTYPSPVSAYMGWQLLTRVNPISNGPESVIENITPTVYGMAHPVIHGPYGNIANISLEDVDMDETKKYASTNILATSSTGNIAISAAELK